ncbi:MAG: cytochrome c biogenesis protein CcsA [Planctomycetes bacterium]|nr:cytochrome c biogenesis protein CcsA [Planctomycetota bacterium]
MPTTKTSISTTWASTARAWIWLCLLFVVAGCSRAAPKMEGVVLRKGGWDPAFVAEFGKTMVMNEGRVQPVSTLASYTLYAVHGRRDVQFETADGQTTKLSPTEWLLDAWCYPEQASHYPLFRIENVSVLDALGIHHDGQGQRFEYLTYARLLESGEKLEALMEKIDGKAEAQRSPVERHLVLLWRQLLAYHRMHRLVDSLQVPLRLEGDELKTLFGGSERIPLTAVLRNVGSFRDYVRSVGDDFAAEKHGNLSQVLSFLQEVSRTTSGALLLPPTQAEGITWHSFGEVLGGALTGRMPLDPSYVAMMAHLETGLQAETLGDRQRHLLDYKRAVEVAAKGRVGTDTVETEAYYYTANWHFHAMMTFVLGFVLACVCWALPKSRLLWWASAVTTLVGIVLLVVDVWIRCLVTGHPPITRLYDTFLFIGGVAAIVIVAAEFLMPRRILLALAPFLGALLIFLARLFEVADGRDTMQPLQAVLLSNFWLGIHVPTMNIGYGAGVAAACVAMAWVAVRALGLDKSPQQSLLKMLAKVTYGVTCFSLATGVVGTILGGVWANDSWGRFWGWDPKENGALLICLSQIALLHARMCGMVRDPGLVLWSIFSGMIVVFSWFHTNLLGVGLHAYGFSGALHDGVWISYSVLLSFLVLGAIDLIARPNVAPASETLAAAADAMS